MPRTDILLFAEDPGVANYAALLMPVLASRGWGVRLFASAVASNWLKNRGVLFTEVTADADAESLLREVDPRCVMTGTAENPETLGLRLIDAAHEAGIPSVGFIDALMSAAYRFSGSTRDPLAHAPDWLLVPDSNTLEAFAVLGYQRQRIAICGHPQYEQTRVLAAQWASEGGPQEFRRRLFPELDPGRQLIVFVSEGIPRFGQISGRVSYDFGFQGRGINKGRTRIIFEEVLDAVAELSCQPYVIFRAHPTENVENYAEYQPEIHGISSDGSPLELVYAADLVIGMTSMLLLEAALLGRPTLAVLAHASEADWLPSVRNGLTPHVQYRLDLRKLMPKLLSAIPPMAADGAEDTVVLDAEARITQILYNILSHRRDFDMNFAKTRSAYQ